MKEVILASIFGLFLGVVFVLLLGGMTTVEYDSVNANAAESESAPTLNLPSGEDFVQYIPTNPNRIITRNRVNPHLLSLWSRDSRNSLKLFMRFQEN